MNKFLIDKLHNDVELFDYPFSNEIWEKKYKYNDENSMSDTIERVCKAIYKDSEIDKQKDMEQIMNLGLFMPGGRILAGAGTTRKVTLMNCYVNDTLHDSMDGIVREGLGNAAKTLQMGGGIGTDFSPIRPKGAELRQTGTGAIASGPISFMEMFNAMSLTVMSAGERRGAMMGTLSDTHPDLIDFITAKQTQGVLTQFNISVLISDKFMEAVEYDGEWKLYFDVPPVSNKTNYFHGEDYEREGDGSLKTFKDKDNVTQYVYSINNARYIWNLLMESAYKYSEPGVIFIDTIDLINNLRYCEDIRCTNPCGEQPLPPNGTCNLGAINLSRFVIDPFTKNAKVNYKLLRQITTHAIEFLDLVIDVTMHPLESQAEEQRQKRRIGLGISGLADLFSQLGIVYGSEKSIEVTNTIMIEIASSAYSQSMSLAKVKGKFNLYEESYWNGTFAGNLVEEGHITRTSNLSIGIRNSHLLTIAPTGTTSILYGNISSGLEPVFSHSMKRKVKNYDGTFTEHENTSYIYRLYDAFLANDTDHTETMLEGSEFMITTQDDKLNWKHHLNIQAACQKWIDASVSKTINLPENITLEEVKHVYLKAHRLDCKGCTIYRPSEVRGSIITDSDSEAGEFLKILEELPDKKLVKEVVYGDEIISDTEFENLKIIVPEETPKQEVYKRSSILHGMTGKLKWPSLHSSIYITVNFNHKDGKVFEIFFSCKDHTYSEWLHALGILFSICIQAGAPINKICKEMMYIHATNITIHEGKFTPSLIHAIANKILEIIKLQNDDENDEEIQLKDEEVNVTSKYCNECATYSIIVESGCEKCTNCGASKCD